MSDVVLEPVTDRTPQHAEHDPFAIAQLAADDLRPSERPRVERLAAECTECAALLDDLRSLTTATAALPAMPAGLRSRDFRLTEADAARLRKGGWRRRFAGLRSPRFAFVQPLGVAISTLALAGLLITGGGLPFLATTSAPVSAPAPAGTGGADGAAVREAPTEPATDTSDGSEFTTRVASEAPASAAPAAAMPAPTEATTNVAPMAGGAQGPAESPQVETMLGSGPPEDSAKDQGTSADVAPAPTEVPAPGARARTRTRQHRPRDPGHDGRGSGSGDECRMAGPPRGRPGPGLHPPDRAQARAVAASGRVFRADPVCPEYRWWRRSARVEASEDSDSSIFRTPHRPHG